MKIKDKKLKKMVDVCDADCPNRKCYWARPDPGVFVQGRGYRQRGPKPSTDYICGQRAIHGCPDKYYPKKEEEF